MFHTQPFGQTNRVERRVNFGVIVEIDEDRAILSIRFDRADHSCIGRLRAPPPKLDSLRPPLQFVVGVTADIELLGTVQTDVHKIRREILAVGPFLSGIGENEGDVVLS